MLHEKEGNSSTVFENTMEIESLGYFFRNLEKDSAGVGTKLATNRTKNFGRASRNGAEMSSAAVSISLKA